MCSQADDPSSNSMSEEAARPITICGDCWYHTFESAFDTTGLGVCALCEDLTNVAPTTSINISAAKSDL